MRSSFAHTPLILVLFSSSVLAQSLTGIRIQGPDEVEEHTSGVFRVFAAFDGAVEYEVTLSSSLSVSPGAHASINEFGVLMASGVDNDEVETIHALFEHDAPRTGLVVEQREGPPERGAQGVRQGVVRFRSVQGEDRDAIVELCEELIGTRIQEVRHVVS